MKFSLLIAGLKKQLEDNEYAQSTIRTCCRFWTEMENLFQKEYGTDEFDLDKGVRLLEKHYQLISNHQKGYFLAGCIGRKLHMLDMLQDFKLHGTLIGATRHNKHPACLKGIYLEIREGYRTLVESMELCPTTAARYLRGSTLFLEYLQQLGIAPEKVQASHCLGYLNTFAGMAPNTISKAILYLKHLLGFMHSTGRMGTMPDLKIAKPKMTSEAPIPSYWTVEELGKLLAAVDRNNPNGKRDYAMLLLACVLGLRSSDIRKLKIEDIDWHAKKITIIQSKTKKPLSVPLPPGVIKALADYLSHGRPSDFSSHCVFIRHRPPFDPMVKAAELSCVVEHYRAKAGIVRYHMRSGFHSLRHTAASNLLEMETPLSVITQLLGHADPATTAIYLKRDLAKLAECVLDPEDFPDVK